MDEVGASASICRICLKEFGKYSCPRCNIRYCSSTCYKSESHADCSESFYHDCFMEGLKDCEAGPDDKRKMMEMLDRVNKEYPDEEDDDEDDELELEDRLAGLDLDKDTQKIWENLTEKERREFQDMLKDGRLTNLVEPWDPWWTKRDESLIREVGEGPAISKDCPPVKKKIPDISKVIKGEPSEKIKYNVFNIIYGYAYITRLHNGDPMDMAGSAAEGVEKISESLGERNFSSIQEALHSCLDCIYKNQDDLGNTPEFSVAVIQDAENIIHGPSLEHSTHYVLSALSDLYKLLHTARKEIDLGLEGCKQAKIVSQLKKTKQKYLLYLKKIEFLLGWTQKYGFSLMSVIPELQIEFCTMTTNLSQHKDLKEKIEDKLTTMRNKQKGTFIQEVNKKVTFNEDLHETSIDEMD